MFTHLHVHTEYSLLDGLSRITPLVQRAKELGMDSLAITDHGGMYGAVEFYSACREAGIKPIIGCEVYVADGSRHSKTPADKSPYHLTLLAKNDTGYHNLIKLVTKANLEGFYYKPRIDRELMEEHHDGLIALSGCPSGEVPRRIIEGRMDEARERALWFKEVFGDYYLELQYHEHIPELEPLNSGLIAMSRELDIPLVLTNDCHYVAQEDAPIQDLLICIQTNTNVLDEKRMRMEDHSYHLRSSDEMAALFPELTEAYENTQRIAEQCNVELDFSQMHLPEYGVPDDTTPEEYLSKLCWDGLERRRPGAGAEYRDRLTYELSVIEETSFTNYFLVVWDIAAFTREQGILFGVRGSAAASLALYALGVTDIDPLVYRLVFERFLNLGRKEMPDIDMDFQDDRRDEVLHYVVGRYGQDHVAQIITFGTMGPKAALRDTGRALAIPFAEVDQVARLVPFRARTLDEALETVPELQGVHEADEMLGNLIDNAKRLEGVVRHSSTHAAGVLISKDPLTEYVPLQRPIKGNDDDLAMTQYSMEPIAQLGLLKMDFLGLSNLSILDKAIQVIAKHTGEQLDLHQVPLDDAKTFDLLSSGQTTGIFQLEGSGMRRHIKNLKPRSLMDISAMIALYRPGPMEHIDTYIQASHGEQQAKYPHPVLEGILEETHGVIVYQDQVLLIVQAIAGYSLGEADIVRKAMGKKIPAIMQEERQGFVTRALAQGFDQELADQIFALIEPFAGYAFNKAHSVSYALIAYWTAYFKANYPVEYMVALLNSHSGQQDRIAIEVDECVRLKIQVLPPDINRSDTAFTVDTDPDGQTAIRFGLGSVKHVGSGALEALIHSRVKNGPFASLEDLCRNGDLGAINRRALESLVKVGALQEFGSRGSLLASMDRILAMAQRENQLRQSGQTTMFDLFGDSVDTPLGAMELVEAEEASPRERQAWERELLGKQISDNPISTIAFDPNTDAITFLEELSEAAPNKPVRVVGQVYSVRNPRTKDGRTFAAVELELFGGQVEVVAWPELYEKDPDLWAEGTFLLVTGKVRTREDTVSIHAEKASLFTADGDVPLASEPSTAGVETVPPDSPIEALEEPPDNLPHDLIQAPDEDIPAETVVVASANGASKANGNGIAAGSRTNGTNGKNGPETPQKHTLLISLTDSGDPSEDSFLVQSAIRLTLEFPGTDAVQLEISSNGRRVRLEMPLISTQLCQELEDRMAALIGPGRARAV